MSLGGHGEGGAKGRAAGEGEEEGPMVWGRKGKRRARGVKEEEEAGEEARGGEGVGEAGEEEVWVARGKKRGRRSREVHRRSRRVRVPVRGGRRGGHGGGLEMAESGEGRGSSMGNRMEQDR